MAHMDPVFPATPVITPSILFTIRITDGAIPSGAIEATTDILGLWDGMAAWAGRAHITPIQRSRIP